MSQAINQGVTPPDPYSQLLADEQAFTNDTNALAADQAALTSDLKTLDGMHDAFAKFMYILMVIMPAMGQTRGDNIKIQGDAMNIDSDMRSIASQAQGIFNNQSFPDTTDFYVQLYQLYNWLNGPNAVSMQPAMKTQLTGQIAAIFMAFPTTPNGVQPGGFNWVNPYPGTNDAGWSLVNGVPTPPPGAPTQAEFSQMQLDLNGAWASMGTTGQMPSWLKNISDSFTTITQTVSNISQATGTLIQFYTNDFNQYLGLFHNALDAENKQVQSCLDALKSQS